jgi:DUF438 domain-containing protein
MSEIRLKGSDKMLNTQFSIKRIHMLKDILLRLHHDERFESIQPDIDLYFKDASVVEILLIEQEIINEDNEITIEDVMKLSDIHPHLYSHTLNEEDIFETNHPGHPVYILKKENKAFQAILDETNLLLESLEKDSQHVQKIATIEALKQQIFRLGEFHKHYHRKEKLYFPIMERYGHFTPTRIMWRGDDQIRALYQAAKKMIDQLPDIDLKQVRKTYDAFSKEFKAMIFQEEALILPIILSTFHEEDWLAIAEESEAFGYALTEPEEKWIPKSEAEMFAEETDDHNIVDPTKNIRFGGGYLTTEEANLILNNLPLEITFVDKNSVFKYFNEITNASDMMLVRTPISIGRNVANCHPPKSLKKVMTIIRDLKTKKRTSESMWFKKKEQYIHITYRALFNEADEFLGILEYVQNIQPFFDLPSEVKTGLSKLDE